MKSVLGAFCVATISLCLTCLWGCGKEREKTTRLVKAVEQKLPLVNSPVRQPEPSAQAFRGLDLTAAPRTTRSSELPGLWEERPEGSRSYEMHKDVICAYLGFDATVYYLPGKKQFYLQKDPLGSSTMTFYGPFDGDPYRVLNLPPEPDLDPFMMALCVDAGRFLFGEKEIGITACYHRGPRYPLTLVKEAGGTDFRIDWRNNTPVHLGTLHRDKVESHSYVWTSPKKSHKGNAGKKDLDLGSIIANFDLAELFTPNEGVIELKDGSTINFSRDEQSVQLWSSEENPITYWGHLVQD